MVERVARVLAAAFPDREVESVGEAGPSWNELNSTVRVEFADGAVYLKVAVDGDGSRIARERAAIDYVDAHCTVPVPRVVASDPDAATPYLATAPMDGEGLIHRRGRADEDRESDLLQAVGRTLARVHAARFDEHGHLTGGGADALELEPGSWTAVLVDRIEMTRDLAGPGRFEGHFDRVVEAVREHRALLDGAPAALVHGDPAGPNCV